MTMTFDISFVAQDEARESPVGTAIGVISIGSYRERFIAPTDYWTPEDYRESWLNALRVVLGSEGKAALITSLRDPIARGIVRWWPVYRVRAEIVLQEQLLMLADLTPAFDISQPFRHVLPFSETDDEGTQLSSWRTSVTAVENYLKRGGLRADGRLRRT